MPLGAQADAAIVAHAGTLSKLFLKTTNQ